MEKKEKIEIYLGNEGVTATSANYIANVAKEMIRKEQADIDNVDFIDTSICAVDSSNVRTTKKGQNEAELLLLPQKIERIAKMKSLIGWLREGIKAKERMIKEIEEMDRDEVLKILGMDLQNIYEDCLEPYTEKTFLETLSADEQRKIQLLNTKAAIYGKFIHEKGPFSKARQKAIECVHQPSEIQKTIGLVTVVESTPSIEIEKIDAVYFELQKKYREVQKELNSHMFKIKEEMYKVNLDRKAEDAMILSQKKTHNREVFEAVWTYRKKEIKRISDLKIVIPQELRDIFDEVNNA